MAEYFTDIPFVLKSNSIFCRIEKLVQFILPTCIDRNRKVTVMYGPPLVALVSSVTFAKQRSNFIFKTHEEPL